MVTGTRSGQFFEITSSESTPALQETPQLSRRDVIESQVLVGGVARPEVMVGWRGQEALRMAPTGVGVERQGFGVGSERRGETHGRSVTSPRAGAIRKDS